MNSPYKGRFKVTQIFKGAKHKGKDLVGIDSKDIFATVNGVVESAQRDINRNNPNDTKYGMGNYIRIKDDATGYRFYFAHLSKIYVKVGQRVSKGDLIGVEGSTGHSTGSHLHYEIRKIPDNTTFLDPFPFDGIPNELGVYIQEDKTIDADIASAMKKVQAKTGFADETIKKLYDAFDDYKYEESFWVKLASAMKE